MLMIWSAEMVHWLWIQRGVSGIFSAGWKDETWIMIEMASRHFLGRLAAVAKL